MIEFMFSSALAFALYELLAFINWPPAEDRLSLRGVQITFSHRTGRIALNLVRAVFVVIILISVLLVHRLLSPFDTMANYSLEVGLGFLFGPLLAIWINSVVVHDASQDLTRGQILAAVGLAVLFLSGMLGPEAATLLKQYASNVSSVKIAGAELSFSEPDSRARIGSTQLAGSEGGTTHQIYVSGGSNALGYLAGLSLMIVRDDEYITLFGSKNPESAGVKSFADTFIGPPLSCLFGWFQLTADPGPVNQYFTTLATTMERLDAITRGGNQSNKMPQEQSPRLMAMNRAFIQNNLAVATTIAASTADKDALEGCRPLLEQFRRQYCPEMSDTDHQPLRCLQKAANEVNGSSEISAGRVEIFRADILQGFIDPANLTDRPYFAIVLASTMAQLGRYEAAASVLDDWLRQQNIKDAGPDRQKEYGRQPELRISDEWYALRARSMLAAYAEEWLAKDDTRAPTVVQDEHLKNLEAYKNGLKRLLMKADFFQEMEKKCTDGCDVVFRRPGECSSNEPSAKLAQWRQLYTGYITADATYIDRSLKNPDYSHKFAETCNREAERLVNFDMSCGAASPKQKTIYAQSLLTFARNAVRYASFRSETDSETEIKKRLDKAEEAVKFGLEIIDTPADEERQRADKGYIERVRPSFTVEVQELLKAELVEIAQAKANLPTRSQ